MLLELTIENVALIERAEITFHEGLNVLSGETGAGKSVILDCIDFVLGAKADKEMVRHGAPFCSVGAVFSSDEAVNALLEELGAEADDEIVITRKLTADGKGTLRLNGMPVTVSTLRSVTSRLVDVHGQSEHFFLLKESNQLRMLDAVSGEPVKRAKEKVVSLVKRRKEIVSALSFLGGDEGERNRRLDILKFQIDEIENADLKENEKEQLLVLREKYRNAEKIAAGLSSALDYLLPDGAAVDALHAAAHAVSVLSRYSEEYSSLADRLEEAASEVFDAAEEVENAAEELDVDERDAERVENRLDEIKALEKKYGGSYSGVMAFLSKAREEFEMLSKSGERYEQLTKELNVLDEELFNACNELTSARKEGAKGFTARVTEELKTLNMPSARFEVRFGEYSREDVPKATSEGFGGVCFYFSANAGEPPKELGKIVSGGEMSRFMLAVKAQLSGESEIGTYLFDEIDAGIGGRTARVVGEKFVKISRGVQVIAVSHLAQVASFADASFLIEKTEENGRAKTNIRRVEGEERTKEIARLLGGDDSEHALLHAKEMLEGAEIYKKSL